MQKLTALAALVAALTLAWADLARSTPDDPPGALGLADIVAGTGDGGQEEAYTVQPGDTLSEIAQLYGTTVAALAELNGIVDRNLIRSGQTLRIPPAPPPGERPSVARAGGRYAVAGAPSGLRARARPSLAARPVASLREGALVRATGRREGDWVEIERAAGATAWVHGDFLDDPDAAGPAGPALRSTADGDGDGRISHAEGVAYLRRLGGRYVESRPGATRFDGLTPHALLILEAAAEAYREVGAPFVVTGAAERSGHSRGSLHYVGRAVDLRARSLSEGRRLRAALRRALTARGVRLGGSGGYDVIVETRPLHVHVERNW